MKLDIINDLRKLPAEFFGQEYDSDLFVCAPELPSARRAHERSHPLHRPVSFLSEYQYCH